MVVCPRCGGPASQPIMEIYCLKDCRKVVTPPSRVLFKWQDNSGFWWHVEMATEFEMQQNDKFIFYHKQLGVALDTFDAFCKMSWIDPIDGEPDNFEYWDKGRVGWGQFNIRRFVLHKG